ncbi:type VI secretion system ImpA family N-terminal domain-containing protein [Vibrio sp. SS-MA-C1-2]|uniref:type VI secretion system protein TssA n=1 Tax=Vibrio sp. SS-MA-C1-2 TaxID=2908646 RepID=UPI001F24447A|nr:type VI secretion system ImpA family N-terminal domain-containing protein [Vibrio sp. SS-MA-C1-2]UJF17199.1 type VI secretion system ImpA family N-terminal domain-containing protein [Vibrio sp. SS-MA-C1-2]
MFESLISPISDDNPGGEYLKENRSLYRPYRNAFNMALSSFRQLVETPEASEDAELQGQNRENWHQLSELCQNCLQNNAKDIEIFSWFTVSQLFSEQPLNNLKKAFETLDYYIDNYWDTLQPLLPENKRKGQTEDEINSEIVDNRVRPLLQLVGDSASSGLLFMPLQIIEVIHSVNYGQYYQAQANNTLEQLKNSAILNNENNQSDIEINIILLSEILSLVEKIETELAVKCQNANVNKISFLFLKETINNLINSTQFLVGDLFSVWPLDKTQDVISDNNSSDDQGKSQNSISYSDEKIDININTLEQQSAMIAQNSNQTELGNSTGDFVSSSIQSVNSREQAFIELQKIADYFEQTEPHSPIYLLLKRAIRWGGMPLPELLQELIGSNSNINERVENLIGLESANFNSGISTASQPKITPKGAVPMANPNSEVTVSMPASTDETGHSTTENKAEVKSSEGLSDIEW